MARTIVQKVLEEHVEPGADVSVGVTCSIPFDGCLLNEMELARVAEILESRGDSLSDPRRLNVVEDRLVSGAREVASHHRAQSFLAANGVTHQVRFGRGGLAVHEFIDRGEVTPGNVVIGADHRMAKYGALGALPICLTDAALATALATGRIELTVPATVRVVVKGGVSRWGSGRDIGLRLMEDLSAEELAGRSIELVGKTIDQLDLVSRLDLAEDLTRLGATVTFLPADESALAWLRARSSTNIKSLRPDAGAEYERVVEIDLDGVGPSVAHPLLPMKARRITEFGNVPVDVVVIGGSSGGRIEELRTAARLLKEHPLHERVRLIVIPATQKSLVHAVAEGVIAVLIRAGAMILAPGGGVWDGESPMLAPGERSVTTSWVEFANHERAADPELYVGSAAVAAASAVMGRLAHPDEVLRSRREAV